MIKVGILGGTFDPFHNGHLYIARKALEIYKLDKIIIIPSGVSYLKSNVTPAVHRFYMAKASIENEPKFEISSIEIDRKGNTYTFETLEDLKKQNEDYDLYFILGADSLLYIDKWYQPERIFKACTLICAVRDGNDINVLKAKGKELEQLGAKVLFLDIDPMDVSSTKIRSLIQSNGSISGLVNEEVERYILKEHLYEIH